jgi:hypothetical protein
MSVETNGCPAQGLGDLMAPLWEGVSFMPAACRRTAAFILDYFARELQLPSICAIAAATHTSHGTAQRLREAVLEAFRHTAVALDLHRPKSP